MPVTLAVATLLLAVVVLAGCGDARDAGDRRHEQQDVGEAHVRGLVRHGDPRAGRSREGCRRPYDDTSPWNTPIPRGARVDGRRLHGTLTSDPTQYTYPYYSAGEETPRRRLRVDGTWSDVTAGGRILQHRHGITVPVPVPAGAAPAMGSDAQIVIVDRRTGDEWGAWQLRRDGRGWRAENGYHYNVRWSGVPPRAADGTPFGSRGAGVPYLAGLVRRCEILRGRIDHALAFAYDSPSAAHVPPATKSDGTGSGPQARPEGTRLQLDPSLSRARLRRLGCTGPCLTIARALRRYGMYVIDGSGRPKVMLEYEGTARWRGAVRASTVSPLPLSAFRVLEVPDG
jgi:hypothetical protein